MNLSKVQIDRKLAEIKRWYKRNYPLCVFCHHKVKDGELAHLIRRSYTSEIMTLKLNTGLAHHDCHEIFDDHPDQAQYLPRMKEVMYIIWLLDQEYFNQIADKYPELADIFAQFPDVRPDVPDLNHHGELLQLQYLVQ